MDNSLDSSDCYRKPLEKIEMLQEMGLSDETIV